jgi:hypothetical protein
LVGAEKQIIAHQLSFPYIATANMMYVSFLPSILLAMATNSNINVNNPTVHWFIDGNNMLGQRGIPKDRELLSQGLQAIQQQEVQLVFDGRKGTPDRKVDELKKEDGSIYSVVYLEEGLSTDDYILKEIETMLQHVMEEDRQENLDQRRRITKRKSQIQVVTADRDLRKRSLAAKRVVRDVVNPITFWRRYVPRLTGVKKFNNTDSEEEATGSSVA